MFAKVQLTFAGGYTHEDAWIPREYAIQGRRISVVTKDEKVWGCTVTTVYPLDRRNQPTDGDIVYSEVIPF